MIANCSKRFASRICVHFLCVAVSRKIELGASRAVFCVRFHFDYNLIEIKNCIRFETDYQVILYSIIVRD